MLRACVALSLLLFTIACAEPPSKEMDQAQGAIDAATAAGAREYAADELTAAVGALARAHEAVAAQDYRLALAHALDSRERAQNAAKAAVDARARARGDAERRLAEATALVDRAEARLKAPDVPRLNRRAVTAAQASVATARKTLQEARAALDRDEYAQVGTVTTALSAQIAAAIDALAPPAAHGSRGRTR
jgi:hypothetical protein